VAAEHELAAERAAAASAAMKREVGFGQALAALIEPLRTALEKAFVDIDILKSQFETAQGVLAELRAPTAVLAATAREFNERFAHRQDKV
jgi:hypothetical protein